MEHKNHSYPSSALSHADRKTIFRLSELLADELGTISDYLYYSIVFDTDMPQLSELFEKSAEKSAGIFRRLGKLILSAGADVALNTRIKSEPVTINRDIPRDIAVKADNVIAYLQKKAENTARRYASLCEYAEKNMKIYETLSELACEKSSEAKLLRDILRK